MKSVKLWHEPRKRALSQIDPYKNEPEMTDFESGFLCGLIREKRPEKIVEVGVAAGGTTAIVLECLDMLGLSSEFYSVDISSNFYKDTRKETGFMIKGSRLLPSSRSKHEFHLGRSLPECIDEIGAGIDFIILDTYHGLPGEVLDFLAAYPYLSDGATVVLHDVALNLIDPASPRLYATKVLFDTVMGEKYYMRDDMSKGRSTVLPNIAAFDCNEDTERSVRNCFSSLSLTWMCTPNSKLLDYYRNIYIKHYDEGCIFLFDNAREANLFVREKGMPFKERLKRSAAIMLKGR